MRSIAQAQGALSALAELLPDTAERVTADGTEEVPIGALQSDDVVLVRPGRASRPTGWSSRGAPTSTSR